MSEMKSSEQRAWQSIETAPRNQGILASDGINVRETWFGKASHVPLYGWCYIEEPGDFENVELWEPTMWREL